LGEFDSRQPNGEGRAWRILRSDSAATPDKPPALPTVPTVDLILESINGTAVRSAISINVLAVK